MILSGVNLIEDPCNIILPFHRFITFFWFVEGLVYGFSRPFLRIHASYYTTRKFSLLLPNQACIVNFLVH